MFDAVVVVSFGGPETSEDVMPFLRHVTRGRGVPEERLAAVAEHYVARGGSPINEQNRLLVRKLTAALADAGLDLPVYWGNRNWHPFLADTAADMSRDGVRRALAFVTSAFGSYSGCRQYREDIASACSGVQPALAISKLRLFYNHPGFIQPMAEGVRRSLEKLADRRELTDGRELTGGGGEPTGGREPTGGDRRELTDGREPTDGGGLPRLLFSAHSIPASMAATAPYEAQLREAAALIAERVGKRYAEAGEAGGKPAGEAGGKPAGEAGGNSPRKTGGEAAGKRAGKTAGESLSWDLVFQSRSGDPRTPWLEPDVNDHLRSLADRGVEEVVLVPLGFVSDHMEVIQDLDCEAAECAAELGVRLIRSPTVGAHPTFVSMIAELIEERLGTAERRWLGDSGPWPDDCEKTCCVYAPPAKR